MRCATAKKWISEYVDGDLDSGRRTRLEEHMAGCPDCRKLAQDFRKIAGRAPYVPSPDPRDETWGKIQARLAAPGDGIGVPPYGRPAGFPSFRWGFVLGAAAVLAVVAGALLLGPRLRERSPMISQLEVQGYTLAKLEEAEMHYQRAIKALAEAVAVQGDRLDPNLAEVFRANLKIINASIAACRQAVLDNPRDLDSRRFLLAAYQEKADLLEKMMSVKDESSRQGSLGDTL